MVRKSAFNRVSFNMTHVAHPCDLHHTSKMRREIGKASAPQKQHPKELEHPDRVKFQEVETLHANPLIFGSAPLWAAYFIAGQKGSQGLPVENSASHPTQHGRRISPECYGSIVNNR